MYKMSCSALICKHDSLFSEIKNDMKSNLDITLKVWDTEEGRLDSLGLNGDYCITHGTIKIAKNYS